jgi:dienelactone hydrolase
MAMGRRRISLIAIIGLSGLLLVPVAIEQASPEPPRTLQSVRLAGTVHQEIRFRNAAQGIELAGLLFVPRGDGPFPAAVIIHGSGSSRRDNGWYVTLASYLQEQGILVLLPDKRGSEGSGGDWRTASYEDLATDTQAAVAALRSRSRPEVSSVGLIGLSQGGRIAPIAAARTDGLAFVVNMVGGAVPAHEALVFEETHNLRQLGVLPGLAHVLAYPGAWSIIYVRQKAHWDAVGNFDPLPYWQRLDVPVFVLYGEADTNVNTAQSAARLRGLGKSNMTVKVYPGSGHALEDPPGQGDALIRRDALRDIAEFIDAARITRSGDADGVAGGIAWAWSVREESAHVSCPHPSARCRQGRRQE